MLKLYDCLKIFEVSKLRHDNRVTEKICQQYDEM